jgi:hypothetical protein
VEDLKTAAEILAVCAKITYLEKLFEEQK